MMWELQYLSSGIDGARGEVKVVVKQTKNWNIDFTKVFQKILKYKLFGSVQIAKVNLGEIKTVYVIHDKVAKCQFPVAKGRKWRSGSKVFSAIFGRSQVTVFKWLACLVYVF